MEEGRAGQRGISRLQEGSSVLKEPAPEVIKVQVTLRFLFQALTAFTFQEQQIKGGSLKILLPDKGLTKGPTGAELHMSS